MIPFGLDALSHYGPADEKIEASLWYAGEKTKTQKPLTKTQKKRGRVSKPSHPPLFSVSSLTSLSVGFPLVNVCEKKMLSYLRVYLIEQNVNIITVSRVFEHLRFRFNPELVKQHKVAIRGAMREAVVQYQAGFFPAPAV